MIRILIAAFFAILLSANAAASEPRILKTGDVLEIEEGETLRLHDLRKILLDYGYSRLGTGGEYGQILVTTAFGPDKNKYEIKVHSRTGEVLRAWAIWRLY